MNHVTIGDGCSIQGSVICSNAQLQERVVLKDCQVLLMLTQPTVFMKKFSVSLVSWCFTPGWSWFCRHFWQWIQRRVPGKEREMTTSMKFAPPGHHIVFKRGVFQSDPVWTGLWEEKTHGGLRNSGHHVIFLKRQMQIEGCDFYQVFEWEMIRTFSILSWKLVAEAVKCLMNYLVTKSLVDVS